MRTISVVILLAFATSAAAESGHLAATKPAPDAPDEKPWSVEADLVGPWIPQVHIISARVTHTLWGTATTRHGDAMLGVYVRPRVGHDIVETIDEYLLSIGYRQALWRGLHLEAAVLAGWSWGTRNKIDGMDYSSPSVLVEGLAGYRIDLGRFYLTPQAGVLAGIVTDIGPRGGKSDVFVEGKLLAGLTW
ncbi:MAG: autotransporter domain-containing protein [Myxococcales bacterium]|nr:autotransporter domain-containing protein [Myxococcales bacterium]